jgi:hypothetical protein
MVEKSQNEIGAWCCSFNCIINLFNNKVEFQKYYYTRLGYGQEKKDKKKAG